MYYFIEPSYLYDELNRCVMVILYASDKATTAANRAALVMDYAGVKDIRLLNGGKMLWELENRPMVKGSETPEKKEFGTNIPSNSDIIYSYEDEALDISKELVESEDIHAFILCPGFSNSYVGAISSALGENIAVNVARGDGKSSKIVDKIIESVW